MDRLADNIPIEFPLTHEKAGDRPIVFVAGNRAYIKHFLPSFAYSTAAHAQSCDLHVHMYDPDIAAIELFIYLKRKYPENQLSLTIEYVNFDGKENEFIASYCASIRFVRGLEIFKQSKRPVMMVDIDAIFVNSFKWSQMSEKWDVSFFNRFHLPEKHFKIMCGTILFQQSETSYALWQLFADKIAKDFISGHEKWYQDQVNLFDALEEIKQTRKLYYLPLKKKYIDWDFDPQSIIWTGKGDRKVKDQIFVKKLEEYRAHALKI